MQNGSLLPARAAGALLAGLGLLPIANWIAGGHDVPWYPARLHTWLIGSVVIAAIGAGAAAVVVRRDDWWPAGRWQRIADHWFRAGWRGDLLIGAATTVIAAAVALLVFGGRALSLDELSQLFEARILATGHLTAPAPDHPGFTVPPLIVVMRGRMFSQFPPGWAALLVPGVLLGVPWMAAPLMAGAGVVLLACLVRRIEVRRGAALAAILLFALSPFLLFLAGTLMNHVACTVLLIAAALALHHATDGDDRRGWPALWCGVALGAVATIRPLDATAFALPTAAWFVARWLRAPRPQRRARLRALLAAGAGVAIPVALLLASNSVQTGAPLRFGYSALWGPMHGPGFHPAPWGPPHTPARGLELINIYLLELQTSFLETPAPALLFATVALLLATRLTSFDRWILAASGALLAGYFSYWFNGYYLGPRFMLPLLPWLALWTARLPALLRERGARVGVRRAALASGVVALGAGAIALPTRVAEYHRMLPLMRTDMAALAARAGVRRAVVLVREGWSAQLVARMRNLGIGPGVAVRLLRTRDACGLDGAIGRMERDTAGAGAVLDSLLRGGTDSARLVRLAGIPDTALRFRPGAAVRPECLRRLREDVSGFTVYSAVLPAAGDGNVYLRDLHALDTVMLARFPARPLWVLTEGSDGRGLRLVPASIDSMEREWQADPGRAPDP